MQPRIIIAVLVVLLSGVTWYGVRANHEHVRSVREKTILSHLRQIDAAIDGFHREHGRYPTSLEEIVGPNKFLKTLDSVDGEDYHIVDVSGGELLRVTTKDGIAIVYSRATGTGVNAPR